ncbi:hypothetical protein EJ02DRAFT_419090 [Clathrospora elynae]|uniref:Uncharacterized protein n=1 Tax=Clathrospora elynae TaxID=706981 RepID=A0A6A5T1X0_9PLEO|nr:hypothetical protein EJ02DRAFT_419090 [Clathrospora elynae]
MQGLANQPMDDAPPDYSSANSEKTYSPHPNDFSSEQDKLSAEMGTAFAYLVENGIPRPMAREICAKALPQSRAGLEDYNVETTERKKTGAREANQGWRMGLFWGFNAATVCYVGIRLGVIKWERPTLRMEVDENTAEF